MVQPKNVPHQTSSIRGDFYMLYIAVLLTLSATMSPSQPAFSQEADESAKEEKVAAGPNTYVHCVSFSADGKLLAGASFDSTVKIWDAQSGDFVRSLSDHKLSVRAVAFAPQGSLLASGGHDRQVILWDANTGRRVQTLEGFAEIIKDLKFTADGKTVWVAGNDITSWDVETGKKLSTIKLGAAHVRSLYLSPDNQSLALSVFIQGKHQTGRIYDLKSGKLKRSFGGNGWGVYSVCFSPDGKHLAGTIYSLKDGPKLQVWNIQTGELQQSITLYNKNIWSISYSPDGTMLASGGTGRTIRTVNPAGSRQESELTIWDPSSGEMRTSINGVLSRLRSPCFSPDNKRVAYCDGATVAVFDVESENELWSRNYGSILR